MLPKDTTTRCQFGNRTGGRRANDHYPTLYQLSGDFLSSHVGEFILTYIQKRYHTNTLQRRDKCSSIFFFFLSPSLTSGRLCGTTKLLGFHKLFLRPFVSRKVLQGHQLSYASIMIYFYSRKTSWQPTLLSVL